MNNLDISNPSYISVVDDSSVVRDGLVLHLDAGNYNSYPKIGTTWFDLSGKKNNMAILATAFNQSTSVKYMDFNGSFGCAKFPVSDLIPGTGLVTAIVWTKILNSTSTFRTLFRGLSSSANHQVIINTGTNTLGYYDGDAGGGFLSAGYDVSTLPGFTTQWNMLTWRYFQTSPYYVFTYNDTPGTTRGSNTDSRTAWNSTRGICSIGAYNGGNQSDPSNASQFWGSVSVVMLYNRILSNAEIIQNYQVRKNRFGL